MAFFDATGLFKPTSFFNSIGFFDSTGLVSKKLLIEHWLRPRFLCALIFGRAASFRFRIFELSEQEEALDLRLSDSELEISMLVNDLNIGSSVELPSNFAKC